VIGDEFVDKTMTEWPAHWFGHSKEALTYGRDNLRFIRELWQLTARENLPEHERELHLRALWVMGFELSRDSLLSPNLAKLPIGGRIKSIVEDGGPLLFGFYTEHEEEQFANCCQTFERVLRRAGLWDECGQMLQGN
jgi:hypothetical protein